MLLRCTLAFVFIVLVHADIQCNSKWNTTKLQEKYYGISANCNITTLKLVHVVFRHGDRTPDPAETFPKDPYYNETFYPYGYGQLTALGKQQEYRIGLALRNRYKDFLGDIWTPEVLDARSTDYNRTKMSLELMLAGLWPPVKEQEWDNKLPWQPIPYNYWRTVEDQLLYPTGSCEALLKLYDDYLNSKDFQQENEQYKDLYQYVEEHTGRNMSIPEDMYNVYFTLFAEERLGYELPEWTKCVWPDQITDMAIKYYATLSSSTEIRRYSLGILLQKIIDDSLLRRDGTTMPEERKMFIYSGHELNVALALISLKTFTPHIPPYASYILMELHEIDGVYGFKVLYQDYEFDSPKLLEVPGCSPFCPIDDFINIIKDELPQQSC